MIKESDILFDENGFSVVREGRDKYSVLVSGMTYAIRFELYDNSSLAVARAGYLAKNSNAERLFAKFNKETH